MGLLRNRSQARKTRPAQTASGCQMAKRALAAGEPRIWPLEQICQIRQAIYRQLLVIALASRREVFNVSANSLP